MSNFVFVGGSQRSGTTLLQTLLCQHPNTNSMLREASPFRFLFNAFVETKKDFTNDGKSYFASPADIEEFYKPPIDAFIKRIEAKFPEAKKIVLKDPHLTMDFPALFELMPEASFVLITRDPRDAIASMVKVGEKMRAAGTVHFFQERDMNYLSNYFKSFYVPALTFQNQAFQQKKITIRYEDLVVQTNECLNTIFNLAGLAAFDYGSSMDMGELNWDEQGPNRYKEWDTELLGKAPSASSVGKFREVLTEEEISIINRQTADFMNLFHYEV